MRDWAMRHRPRPLYLSNSDQASFSATGRARDGCSAYHRTRVERLPDLRVGWAALQHLTMRAAFFGGIYNNYLALEEALRDARRRGAEIIYCLGDVGGFGPCPDRSLELLRAEDIPTVQGNYDDSVGNEKPDCGCGYTDPRDNHYARISYAYTLEKTSSVYRPWPSALPKHLAFDAEGRRYLLVHGSPRQVN